MKKIIIPILLVIIITSCELQISQSMHSSTSTLETRSSRNVSKELYHQINPVFLSAKQAYNYLLQEDEYINLMQPYEAAIRLNSSKDVTGEDYKIFAAEQTLDWDEQKMEKINKVIAKINKELMNYPNLPIPEQIYFILMTGKEESELPYTRRRAIFLPAFEFGLAGEWYFREIITHELFHIITRANPEFRDKLYEVIDFYPCPSVELPAELKSIFLTNPDAPRIEHYIELETESGTNKWVPYLSLKKVDPAKQNHSFRYLMEYTYLKININDEGSQVILQDDYKSNMSEIKKSFLEKVGDNTLYIIHPEEILADNFKWLYPDFPQEF